MAEKTVRELSEKFEMLMNEGLLLQMQYEEGEITFSRLLDHVRIARNAQAELQNLMTVKVTRFYGKCRMLRDKKTTTELKNDHKKTISELGY
jgi:hypothetical protein